jgi:leucyl/phenylalanyl-tRNA--protein transferase
MFLLNPDSADLRFPPVGLASPEGLLAVGGDLRAERLLEAYGRGIFPWYNPGQPILWWSPDPRAVLYPGRLRVSRRLARRVRHGEFEPAFDTRFAEVVSACAGARPGNPLGHTWITDEMADAYGRLHALGHAHSIEITRAGTLIGGLYGVALGGAFFGESMFSHATDGSKLALVVLTRHLAAWGFTLIDCQVPSPHLASLGVTDVRRSVFLRQLDAALQQPGRPGRWKIEPGLPLLP